MSLFGQIKKLLDSDDATDKPKELSLREGTAEMHYFVAAGSLQGEMDLVHGMMHLAELLACDPDRREWLDLIDAYVERVDGNWGSLLPETEDAYFATEALRALLWARGGRLEDAVGRWLAVAEAAPGTRYLEAWAVGFLEREGAMEALPDEVGAAVLAHVLSGTPEYRDATVPRRRLLARFAHLATRLPSRTPRNEGVDMLVAGLHRKAGLFAEGLAYLDGSQRGHSSWHIATARGLIYREMGDTDAARAAFEDSLRCDPDSISSRLETGDMYFRLEEWTEARQWYDQVLAVEADHPWAYPSVLWCEWRLGSDATFPDDSFPRELVTLAHEGENPRARELVSRFYPYVGYLPEPQDATANVARQIRESYDASSEPSSEPAELKLTLSDVEAPSNAIALAQVLDSLALDVELTMVVERIGSPDPRRPVEPVRYQLWRLEKDELVPALAPPPPDVADRIADVARAPYDRERNWASASVVAEELRAQAVESIFACIVHPPSPPDGFDPLAWVPRVQLAATDTLAHLDGGWDDSVRRDALYSVLLGPRDWSTESAILSLTRLVADYDVIATDLHEAYTKLANARPDSGYVCYEHALFSCWRELPHLFPEERDDLENELQRIEAEDDE